MDKIATKVIEALGGPTAVARLCRCSQPAVTQWKTAGIPMTRWLYLHAVRPDVVPEPPHRGRKKGRAA